MPTHKHTHLHMHLPLTHFKFYQTTTHALKAAKTFPHHSTFSLISKAVHQTQVSLNVDVLNQSKLRWAGGKSQPQLLLSKVLEINVPHVMPHSRKARREKDGGSVLHWKRMGSAL